MTLPSKRLLNFAGFLVCAGMMAYALYAEHQLLLEPCPLCVFQRIAVIGMGIAFLLLGLHDPSPGWARRIYLAILDLAAIGGIIVAGRHVWLQNLPPDKVPSCGPGLGYMLDNFPFADALKMVFTGSGECATVDWSLLGLSMPSWVLIGIVSLAAFGFWNNLFRSRA
ncbi:MAG: disulfide bond formation protein B [Woeseiaceae bacterium]